MRQKQFAILIIVAFLLVSFAEGYGVITTGSLSPEELDICGENVQYATIQGQNIFNSGNETASAVYANLVFSEEAGLHFVTGNSIFLGDINPGQSAQNNPSWVIQCSDPFEKSIIAYVNYTSSSYAPSSSLDEAYTVINIFSNAELLANLTISEAGGNAAPEQDIPVISDNTPKLYVSTNKNAMCKGSLDKSEDYEDLDFIFYGVEKEHEYEFQAPISDGEHFVYVQCKDSAGILMAGGIEHSFIIDSSVPTIIIQSPLVISTDYTFLNISTDEKADCRYSHDEDDSFHEMRAFDETDDSSFSVLITNLRQGTYDYYIVCRDGVGNSARKEIEIEVEMPPTAQVVLSDPSPVKEGIVEVSVLPSKKLRAAPTLSYSFTDEPTFSRQISLTRYGSYFKGFMVMEPQDSVRIGVFSFQGFDLNGIKGTEITDGKDFIVDTIKPSLIETVDISTDEEGSIVLSWYYEGEREDYFNIYKSETAGVDYTDLLGSTVKKDYVDDEVISGKKYFYKVAAIDPAGNVGPLSKEVSLLAKKETVVEVVHEKRPSFETLQSYNTTLKALEKLEIDITWAEQNLDEIRTKESAVDELNLIKKVIDAKNELSRLKSQYIGADINSFSEDELTELVERTKTLIANLEKTTPSTLIVEKKTEYVQSTKTSDIDLVVDEVTELLNYSDKLLKEYREENYKLSQNIKVTGIIKTLTIEYLDGAQENKVKVEKSVSYQSPDSIADIKIVEVIPKSIASDLSVIDIRSPDYVILEEDPIIAWNLGELTYDPFQVNYIIITDDFSESAKNTRTVVVTKPELIIPSESALITGFSTIVANISSFGLLQSLGVIIGMIIVLSLLSYYLVAIKEVDLSAFRLQGITSRLPRLDINFKNKSAKRTQNKAIEAASFKESPLKNAPIEEINQEKQELPIAKIEPDILSNEPVVQEPHIDEIGIQEEVAQVRHVDYSLLTTPDQYFFLNNGDVIRSLGEFIEILPNLDERTFNSHVNAGGNDFASWVESVYNLYELGSSLRSVNSKMDMSMILEKYRR